MSATTDFSIPPNKTVMFFGASIGQPYGTPAGAPDPVGISFINLFRAAWEQKGDTVIDYCYANGPATTLADFIANYATLVTPNTQARTGRPLLVVFPGTGSIDVFGGATAAATYALMVTAVGMVHADGGRVMVSEVTPGSFWSGSAEANRVALNVLYAANAVVTTPVFDYYWPLGTIFSITTAAYFGADNQHLSPFGHILVAAQLELAQNNYYRNGNLVSLPANQAILTPATDNQNTFQVQTAAGGNALQFGTFPSLPQFGAIWGGAATPSTTNFSWMSDNNSTISNAATQVLSRIGGVTVAAVINTGMSLIPPSDNRVTLVIKAASGNPALQFGTFDATLPGFGGIWGGNLVADASNYAFVADGTNTILNAGTSILFRIAGGTIAKVQGTDFETVTAGSGLIVAAPNGTRYRISVSNIGVVIATAV